MTPQDPRLREQVQLLSDADIQDALILLRRVRSLQADIAREMREPLVAFLMRYTATAVKSVDGPDT